MSPILSTNPFPPDPKRPGRRRFIAGGLIALAGILPGASVAAEPDQAQEGTAPGQGIVPGSDQPAFDPGGDTALPFDTGPPPSTATPGGDPDDSGPVEREPLSDADVPSTQPNEPDVAPPGSAGDPSVSPLGEAPQAAPPADGFSIEPVPPSGDAVDAPAPSPEAQPLAPERGSEPSNTVERLKWLIRPPANETPSADYETAAISQPEPKAAPPQVVSVETTAEQTGDDSQPSPDSNARFHTVQPGESLWVVAERQLGPGASAAEIADEVARLWELNAETIGTGDPDVIMAGTKLRLR